MHKKIRIAFVYANTFELGGADYCMFKLATSLDRNRFDPIVVLGRPSELQQRYEEEGVSVRIIPMRRIQATKSPLCLFGYLFHGIRSVAALRDFIRREKIDIVHGNDLLDYYGPIAAKIERRKSLQYVRMIRFDRFIKPIMISMIRRFNDVVTPVSYGVIRTMFDREGQETPYLQVIYDWLDPQAVGHGAENNLRVELGLDADVPLVGQVGRLQRWKGQHLFLDAARIVLERFPKTHFIVCGGAVNGRGRELYAEERRTQVRGLGIADHVHFLGHRSDIISVMRTLNVFVHSSIDPDPLPGTVMEASYCGVPVVGACAGGVPEEVLDGVTGYLYTPSDEVDMADKISLLLADENKAKTMGEAGKRYVIKTFTKEIILPKVEMIYQQLLDGNAQ